MGLPGGEIGETFLLAKISAYTVLLSLTSTAGQTPRVPLAYVIFARRKFSPISPPALIGKIFIMRIFCPVLRWWVSKLIFARAQNDHF